MARDLKGLAVFNFFLPTTVQQGSCVGSLELGRSRRAERLGLRAWAALSRRQLRRLRFAAPRGASCLRFKDAFVLTSVSVELVAIGCAACESGCLLEGFTSEKVVLWTR